MKVLSIILALSLTLASHSIPPVFAMDQSINIASTLPDDMLFIIFLFTVDQADADNIQTHLKNLQSISSTCTLWHQVSFEKTDNLIRLLKHIWETSNPICLTDKDKESFDYHNRTTWMHKSTWLHFIASHGMNNVVNHHLLNHSDQINSRDDFQCTPLHYAATFGQTETVQKLLRYATIEVNALDRKEYTPLVCAVMTRNHHIVLELLNNPKIDLKIMYSHAKSTFPNTKISVVEIAGLQDFEEIKKALNDYLRLNKLRSS